MDALGSFTADWRLFGDSAVLHSDSRTVFGTQEQEQEYGHCTLRTADGHSCLTSNQRLHRRMAGMAGDVYHSCFRDGGLHGNHAADDAWNEAQLCRNLQRADDHDSRNFLFPFFYPHLFHPCSLRVRQYDGNMVLSGVPSGAATFQRRKWYGRNARTLRNHGSRCCQWYRKTDS